MRYILYLPSAAERYQEGGRWVAPHPALTVFKERGAKDGKKEILPFCKNKGYTLLMFNSVEEACYFNSGIELLYGFRFEIHRWFGNGFGHGGIGGLGSEIMISREECDGQADGGD